ncbi:MAG: NUDIX hydrolase [Bacteroidaceae bacterium]|nr:NUDIX hydrolase [Bacteroidaceae bacterium]
MQAPKPFQYDYPRPALTADCVVFGLDRDGVKVLLIERGRDPYVGWWAFPGGFVEENECVENCAARELREETHLDRFSLHQFGVFSREGRDPRGWTVSVAFFACMRIDMDASGLRADDDAARLQWFSIQDLPALAFDHAEMLQCALQMLRSRMMAEPLAFDFLPPVFTFEDADTLFTSLFGPDKDVFEWLERMRKAGLVRVHNEDVPSYIFEKSVYEPLREQYRIRFV